MGIYDRDYYREERSGFHFSAPRTAVAGLILVNIAVWILELLAGAGTIDGSKDSEESPLARALSVHVVPSGCVPVIPRGRTGPVLAIPVREVSAAYVPAPWYDADTPTHPWLWWQFVTYGFTHSSSAFMHIFGNMLTLFFLGRSVEQRYGTKEFLRLYFAMLVFAGIVWAVISKFQGGSFSLLGASGAVVGVVVLFALSFPRQTLLLMFVIPVPAWLVGLLMVLWDLTGATGWRVEAGTQTAFTVHLAGAALAGLYFVQKWNFGRWVPANIRWPKLRRPPLRIHDPEPEEESDVDTDKEMDRILEKIHREGKDSLTRKERRFMESCSRELQRRRQSGE